MSTGRSRQKQTENNARAGKGARNSGTARSGHGPAAAAGRGSPARHMSRAAVATAALNAIAVLLLAIAVALPRAAAPGSAGALASDAAAEPAPEVVPHAAPQTDRAAPAPTPPADPGAVEPHEPRREPHQPHQPHEPHEPRREPVQPAAFPGAEPPRRGTLYIIIDDAGYSLRDLEPFLAFPAPLTIAVLPHLPDSREAARLAAAFGKEVMLHLPMEAKNGADPGPGALSVSQDEAEIRRRVLAAFDSVPGARGANNHMGSRATADRRVMDVVMSVFGEHGWWFLDSRTSAETVVRPAAEAAGIPFAERHVFLDNERNHDYIRTALNDGLRVASERGHAVMIGHAMVHELAEVLIEAYPDIIEQGFEFGAISDLMYQAVAHERSGD